MRLINLLVLSAIAIVKPVYGGLDISSGVFCLGVHYTYQELEDVREKNCVAVKKTLSERREHAEKVEAALVKKPKKHRRPRVEKTNADHSPDASGSAPGQPILYVYEETIDNGYLPRRYSPDLAIPKSTYLSTYLTPAHPSYKPVATIWPVKLPQKHDGSDSGSTTQLYMSEDCEIQSVMQFGKGTNPYTCTSAGGLEEMNENLRKGAEAWEKWSQLQR